eukprot:gnl/Spiro4/5810_TR2964_c0_g1_i1.p1 gnl/Spiro4/5810_TR2964_c0_g1~~gnl/Spiro4/5810_TR2964_c0_g1_i1.p1  ORF type:complete len:560 (+),score=107.81 gnl/Spiro4/5810_TR2964_c0_g1_i1:201-1880(+)
MWSSCTRATRSVPTSSFSLHSSRFLTPTPSATGTRYTRCASAARVHRTWCGTAMCCFANKKNELLERGYFQKSVVVFSPLPFLHLFRTTVEALAPRVFSDGVRAVCEACEEISRWPDPVPGRTVALQLLGHALGDFRLPVVDSIPRQICSETPATASVLRAAWKVADGDAEQRAAAREVVSLAQTPPAHRPGLFLDTNLHSTLRMFAEQLWVLWEIVLVGEPLFVLAPSPSRVSETVLAIASLISPILYNGDVRPYFTIHDPDFSSLNKWQGAAIVGGTNPFFLKALDQWRNVMVVASGAAGDPKSRNDTPASVVATVVLDDLVANVLRCHYRPVTHADAAVVQSLLPSSRTFDEALVAEVNNEVLRRHFFHLTQTFLAPFQRYFVVHKLPVHVSPFTDSFALEPFDEHQFLNSLTSCGPLALPVSDSHSLRKLYRRFIRSPNFSRWFFIRQESAYAQLHSMYRLARRNADVDVLMHGLSESACRSFHEAIVLCLARERATPPSVRCDATVHALAKHLAACRRHMAAAGLRLPPLPEAPARHGNDTDADTNNALPADPV